MSAQGCGPGSRRAKAYDGVAGSRAYNANTFASGPSTPFGSATKDSEQASIYATYTPTPPQVAAPVNTGSPSISGTAQTGQTLTSTSGSWSESPSSFADQWQRCNATGASCSPVSGATAQTYARGSSDVGFTMRVAVTASNSAGNSGPASVAVRHLHAGLESRILGENKLIHGGFFPVECSSGGAARE